MKYTVLQERVKVVQKSKDSIVKKSSLLQLVDKSKASEKDAIRHASSFGLVSTSVAVFTHNL